MYGFFLFVCFVFHTRRKSLKSLGKNLGYCACYGKHQWAFQVAQLSSVQSLTCVQLFPTPWTAACQASLSITDSWDYSNSCPLSRWYHPTIPSSVVPFSFCLQSFIASGSFQMSQFFASGGQNIGVSASTSVLPMNIQDWFPSGLTGWISLLSKGLLRVFSTPQFKSINS